MKIINFLRLLGLSKSAAYSTEMDSEEIFHHHDSTDGSELLDETLHMKEQPFEEDENEGYSSIF
ncbi:hypothetical protein [Flavobacterium reichenbachii]|uniref:Uncharacterized protein n=1 Tax=Flavobacterium reichenbachii TaxID=362418 RepID=A0A085ZLP9_9FLAO|nr:hypothetical protein [Flavobacterium reichenbachii]KFF05363.1 hypothetical protein IW19_07400 [Flavobacterium reichenbachii]OXB12290.1 hypothetical protein B0A68_18810 [Flavobacterium reichenbachii]